MATDSERRHGLSELADNVHCLTAGFEEARQQISEQYETLARDIQTHAAWRDEEARPAITRLGLLEDDLRDIKVTARAVGAVITVLAAVLVWVFLTTYAQVQETARLTNENSKIIAVLAFRLGIGK